MNTSPTPACHSTTLQAPVILPWYLLTHAKRHPVGLCSITWSRSSTWWSAFRPTSWWCGRWPGRRATPLPPTSSSLTWPSSDAYFCLMTPIELVNSLLFNDKHVWYLQRFAYGIKDTTPLFLTCICLDRYVAVVHPIVFTSIRDNKIRLAFSMLVWGLMLACALTKSIVGEESTINIFTGLILATFTIMVFCNLSIIWNLRKSVLGKEKIHPMKIESLHNSAHRPGHHSL